MKATAVLLLLGSLVSLLGAAAAVWGWSPPGWWRHAGRRPFGICVALIGLSGVSVALLGSHVTSPITDLLALLVPTAFLIVALLVVGWAARRSRSE